MKTEVYRIHIVNLLKVGLMQYIDWVITPYTEIPMSMLISLAEIR